MIKNKTVFCGECKKSLPEKETGNHIRYHLGKLYEERIKRKY